MLHILANEDVDDIIFCFFTVVCVNSQWKYVGNKDIQIIKRTLHMVAWWYVEFLLK